MTTCPNKWVEQNILIQNDNYYDEYNVTNNKTLSDYFKTKIGVWEYNTYDVMLTTKGVEEFYKFLIVLLGYNGVQVDDRDDLIEIFEMLNTVIRDGRLRGCELLYSETEEVYE